MRLSRDEALMGTAMTWARRSTCTRLQVGAVFSRDGRILVQGYNGAPAGLPHCDHSCDCTFDVDYNDGGAPGHYTNCRTVMPCTTAEHAERNAIAWAARNGVRLEESEAHITDSPCLPCAMGLVNAGVNRVLYVREYRLTDGVELLKSAGVDVEWMDEWEEPDLI